MPADKSTYLQLGLVTSKDYANIPSHILAEYHKRFNSTTYNAFSKRLHNYLMMLYGDTDPFHAVIMNMLIDACFERLGESFYLGAGRTLDMLLVVTDCPELIAAAESHLAHFCPEESRFAQFNTLLQLIGKLAGDFYDFPDRGGRMGAYWLNAALVLVQAAQVAYRAGDLKLEKSYLEEKVRRVKLFLEMADADVAGLSKEKSQNAATL